MGRHIIRKVETSKEEEYCWIVIDLKTGKVARVGQVWLEYLREQEAARLAADLDQLELKKQPEIAQ